MKEFEKWSKKYYPDNVAVFYCNQKEGWKAALEWRLESEFCNVASRQEIEEELGNENDD